MDQRSQKSTKEIIEALLIPEENIKYCAFELAIIRDAYLEHTGIDISTQPAILATAYNLGNLQKLLSKYATDLHARPATNTFGEYISLHLKVIRESLELQER